MFTGAIRQHVGPSGQQNFQTLGLSDPVLATLGAIGFEHPTPIQVAVIPHALAGSDVIGLAQTGSGKTAAFCLPMVERMADGQGIRGLVVCPTREIALQTQAFLDLFSKHYARFRRSLGAACIIGGVRMRPQIDALRREPDILVVTPGRLCDHLERRNVRLDGIEVLVLDEADHMLDLGFMPQITRILDALPAERQTMMFSATMPPPVERLAQRFLHEPQRIDLRPDGRAAQGIEHRLYLVEPDNKKPCLLSLVEQEKGSVLVFVRRKVDADWACRQLEIQGHPVERIHSDLPQSHRVAALSGLREGEHRILVATDIAARGIDIPIIGHIINFNVPAAVEDYIHRAGRTARGASGGIVSTIATWQDRSMIRQIERSLEQSLPRCTAPGVEPYIEPRTTIRGNRRIQRRLL